MQYYKNLTAWSMYFQHYKHRENLALSTTSLDKSMCSYKGHLNDATKELLRKKSGSV